MAFENITRKDIEDVERELHSHSNMPTDTQNDLSQSLSLHANILDRLANAPATQGILGAGDAMASQMHNIANLIPGVNLNDHPLGNPKDMAYKGGELLGNLAGYAGLGALGGEGLGAAESLPLIGRAASALNSSGTLAGILRRGAGNVAYGATMDPENRSRGAVLGGVLSGVGEAIPAVSKGAGNVISSIRPRAALDDILKEISPGNVVQKSKTGNGLYNEIFDQFPDKSIYDAKINNVHNNIPDTVPSGSSNNIGSQVASAEGEPSLKYTDLPADQMSKIYDRGLKLLNKKFIENPSIRNAHSLGSEIGGEIRKLNLKESKLGRLDQSDIGIRDSFKFAQELLRNDIKSFLKSESPELLPKYENANAHWATEVIPHQNALKVISDLGKNITPEKTVKAFQKAQDKKISLPESLIPSIDNLENTIARRNVAQKSAGALLGASLAAPLGPLGEMAGGALGSYVAAPLMRALRIPQLSNLTKKTIGSLYEPTKNLTLANVLKRGR